MSHMNIIVLLMLITLIVVVGGLMIPNIFGSISNDSNATLGVVNTSNQYNATNQITHYTFIASDTVIYGVILLFIITAGLYVFSRF